MSARLLYAGLIALSVAGCDGSASATADEEGAPDATDAATDAMAHDAGAADAGIPDVSMADGSPADAEPMPDEGLPDVEIPDEGPPPDAEIPDMQLDPCAPDGNDTPGQGDVLPVEGDTEGQICANDEDWYVFTQPAGTEGSIRIRLTHADGDLDTALYLDGDLETPVAVSETATDVEQFALSPTEVPRTFHLHIYGYRRAEGPYTITPLLFSLDEGTPVAISGSVQYDDRPFDPSGLQDPVVAPARGIVVQLVRSLDGAVVLETTTDEAGQYTLAGAAQGSIKHYVQALAVSRLDGFEVRVRDRTDAGAIYAVTTEPVLPASLGDTVDLLAPVEEAVAGAFNIADVVWGAFDFIAPYVDGPSPALTFRWQRGLAFACGSCYSRNTISLGGQLEDPDEYDDDIVLHEFGHYFVEHFSHDDSPGGPHRDRQVTPTLAYGEGVAYFFAAMVRGVPDIVDTFLGSTRHIDLEAVTQQGEVQANFYNTANGRVSGDHREELVAAIMWDALDPFDASEPFDLLEIGEAGHMAILVDRFGDLRPPDEGARGTDLADWLNVLACTSPTDDVQLLIEDREYPWTAEADGACPSEKGRHVSPFALSIEADGALWLRQKGAGPVSALRVFSGLKELREVGNCSTLPCQVAASVSSGDVFVVTGEHEGHFVGASWLGEAAKRALLGGELQKTSAGTVRSY